MLWLSKLGLGLYMANPDCPQDMSRLLFKCFDTREMESSTEASIRQELSGAMPISAEAAMELQNAATGLFGDNQMTNAGLESCLEKAGKLGKMVHSECFSESADKARQATAP